MRKLARLTLWLACLLVVILAIVSAILIFPGTPGSARSLRFQGFVLLPGRDAVQVLDYLTVYQRQLFVTNTSAGDVYKIVLRARTLPGPADVSVLKGDPAAHGVIVDPVSGTAFVTRSGANAVDAFDRSTMRSIKRIAVADDPDAILYDPAHRLIYAASGVSMAATLIDPANLKSVATIPLGGSAEFAVFDSRTGLIYQNLSDSNAFAAVNAATRTIVWRYSLKQCEFPTGMAIDEADNRLFIACGKNSRLVIFDLNLRRIVTSVPIGFGTDSAAYDSELHRIYTTGLLGTLFGHPPGDCRLLSRHRHDQVALQCTHAGGRSRNACIVRWLHGLPLPAKAGRVQSDPIARQRRLSDGRFSKTPGRMKGATAASKA